MPRRFLLLTISLIVAAGCLSLGFWQLRRLAQRKALNAVALEHLSLPVIDVSAGAHGAIERFQRIHAAGVFDYSRDVAITARGLNGSPGVHIVTPLVRAQTDTLLLVLRGWVYSPDAATVDFARWRERDTAVVDGFALPFDPDKPLSDSSTLAPHAVRRLDHAQLEKRLGAPVAAYYVVMTAPVTAGDSLPVRVGRPPLDEGQHFSYAVQWFLFAMLFGAGGSVVALRGRRTSFRAGST
jgi:surfeit locus 1 family protein